MVEELLSRRKALLGEIEEVCNRCRRNPGDVRIIAVTKFFSEAVIRAAVAAGFREVGENKVQEAVGKRTVLAELLIRWHGIGHLQTNKAKLAVETFDELHGLDRIEIIDKVGSACSLLGKEITGYLQVNVSGKTGQSGCELEQVEYLLDRMRTYSLLKPGGLMCIAAPVDEVGSAEVRKQFAALCELRDRCIHQGLLPDGAGLSMGMSGDWKLAVSEGATLIRIGTAIFGERNYAA